ncbi:MAG: restriction endonuclease subunit S [Mojavia pulchra JT2-VF2]|uniref:Restriction endonuclease subunit S n=1 Tax=Mojavia pulchra JT2-VF2 TaxID=287848 RepID=A0A951PXA7_9NOST|nr:restriction endonuclease subunit S [Mojavia pulchra JT2-VF2]
MAELIDSLHKTPSYIDEGGFPMVRVTDIKDGVLNLSNARRVDNSTFVEFSKRHTPKIGDIVLSRVGSYGVPALVESDELFCLGQNTVFIIPQINSQLVYFFLRSPNCQQQIEKFVAGTTQGTISLQSIKKIRVPIPLYSEQITLASEISCVLRKTQSLEIIYRQKIAALKELKQSILQKAFTGELTADTPKTAKQEMAA